MSAGHKCGSEQLLLFHISSMHVLQVYVNDSLDPASDTTRHGGQWKGRRRDDFKMTHAVLSDWVGGC